MTGTGDLGLRWTNVNQLGTIDISNTLVDSIEGALDTTSIRHDMRDAKSIGWFTYLAWFNWRGLSLGKHTDCTHGTIGGERLAELRVCSTNEGNQNLTPLGLGLDRLNWRTWPRTAGPRELRLGRTNIHSLCTNDRSDAMVNAAKSASNTTGAGRYVRDTQRVS